jgi:hypothetical protein
MIGNCNTAKDLQTRKVTLTNILSFRMMFLVLVALEHGWFLRSNSPPDILFSFKSRAAAQVSAEMNSPFICLCVSCSTIPIRAEFLYQQRSKEVLFKIHALSRNTKVGQSLGGVWRAARKAFISSVNDFSSSLNINFLFDCTLAFIHLSFFSFLFGLLSESPPTTHSNFHYLYLFARRAEVSIR